MPLNLIKVYNTLLDILALNDTQRRESLRRIFKRDFEDSSAVFKGKAIHPTPREDGELPMDTLYRHLTTEMVNKSTRERYFEIDRSLRLHWVRYHLDEKKKDNMMLFSVQEPEGFRTYYYDKDEKYVIVLEPRRDSESYYLLTAYYLKGKDAKRNKIEKKYKRRLPKVL